jgi:1-deoxy-D-xylulose-5-phosphate synthase
MVDFYGRSVDALVTLEDHALEGGFGSAVLEQLNKLGLTTPVVRVGWPDQFIEHGKVEALRAKYGISVEAVMDKLIPVLAKKLAERFRAQAGR